jgi:hypothetical protein
MNTGQTLITIGAMLILSMTILNVNHNYNNTSTAMLNTKFNILATSLATSMIEEATGKAFDANTVDNTVSSTTSLTAVGPGVGEHYPYFNDFDDFDGYSRIDSTMPSAKFEIACEVDYINPANPNTAVTPTKTWHKKMTVTVTSDAMEDTVRMSKVYSYFYFR